MRACVSIDDSNDEQAMTPHETGTGELHALDFLTRHLAFTTDTSAWRSASSSNVVPRK
jgi:hypothetical protein